MHVVLVGAEFEENLAVRYLRGALEAAGHRVTQVVFNGAGDTEGAAREIAASGASVVGLSMVFTYRAREFVRLAARARELGYGGHVIAGGHFAAFHAETLLREQRAIDSVAIGEGEDLLRELCAHLAELDQVRGLVWRRGAEVVRNPPAVKPPDLDGLAWPPRKQPLDDYLGLPITNILGSRGCGYSCTFCSIVAWHRLCGGERVRMRSVRHVADEMAALWRQGARIFNFHDDNFFLDDRSAMLERIGQLKAALTEGGVGRIAFAIKARPDAVDVEVFEALKALGLFRVFLGIEAGTAEALRRLGRRQTVAQNRSALAVVNHLDIHTAFNLLLFNPDSTLDDVGDNVAFLRAHGKNPMNFCRTEIYAGTPLETKLRREGRLVGDHWGWEYVIADPKAQLAFEVAYRAFRTRNYGEACLHHAAMAVDYEQQLLSHFHGSPGDLRERVKSAIEAVNLNTCEHLDAVVAACREGFGCDAARADFEVGLGRRVAADNQRLGAEVEALLDEIRRAVRKPAASSWGRTVRVVGLAASVTLAATGCKRPGGDSHPTEMAAAPPTAPILPDAAPPGVFDAAPASSDGAVDGAGDAPADAVGAPVRRPDAGAKPPGTHRHEMAPRPPRPSHPSEMVPAPPDDD